MKCFEAIPWKSLKCSRDQIRLDIVLKCGQSFRWTKTDDSLFKGVLANRLWMLKQEKYEILYKTISEVKTEDKMGEDDILQDYFQLDIDLVPLYKSWAASDSVFEDVATTFSGVRMLRQDPVENLFSFICSSNNNIQRISSMVENLCAHYGNLVAEIDGQNYYGFPSIENLANKNIESHLRTLGFGYRAGYISKTALQLEASGGRDFLLGLRSKSYEDARGALLKLSGIGPKVADCILLMSLDKPGAVPVDTHVFQIAARNYLPHLKGYKSVTDKVYVEIGDHFRKLHGPYAGWAHSVLFSADLKHLKEQVKDEQSKSTNTKPTKTKSKKNDKSPEKSTKNDKKKTGRKRKCDS